MDILNLIKTRRSIRKYKKDALTEDNLKSIIEAAMYAPSARNEQPWHFIIINDRKVLDELTKIHPHAQMLSEAPNAILVCADISLERSPGNWPIDCAAATQNILLSAHAQNIASVWLGVYPRNERMEGLAKYFNLPENIKPFSLVALGFANESIETPERYNESRIHSNNWKK